MVFNRLRDTISSLGVLRWLEMSHVPAVDTSSVTHQRLLRAMDTLAVRADAMQHCLSPNEWPQSTDAYQRMLKRCRGVDTLVSTNG